MKILHAYAVNVDGLSALLGTKRLVKSVTTAEC